MEATFISVAFRLENKVIKPGPDRTVRPENPGTVQIHGPFKVRNRSMRKKHGTVRTAVRPSGSVNRDRFTRFGRFPNFSLFFFFPLYGVVPPFFFFFNPLSKITLSLTLKPSLNHSQSSLVSASLKNHSQSSLSQVSITLSSLPLPRHRRTVAAQPRFLPQSSLSQSLSPSSPSHCCSSAQISSSLSQSLNHSLVFTSLPRCRRSSTQIAAHSLTLISASLPRPRRSSLCASSPSPSLVL